MIFLQLRNIILSKYLRMGKTSMGMWARMASFLLFLKGHDFGVIEIGIDGIPKGAVD